jgi:hypothetical protein
MCQKAEMRKKRYRKEKIKENHDGTGVFQPQSMILAHCQKLVIDGRSTISMQTAGVHNQLIQSQNPTFNLALGWRGGIS